MGFSYLRPRDEAGKLNSTWLIQRLDKPYQFQGMDNPFSFGGGYKNGGLSDDAMNILRNIFSFDYMGAAEFEFGSVPEAFQVIAKAADKKRLVAHSFEFDKSKIEKHWSKDATKPSGTATIYVLCEKGDESEVQSRIEGWASARYNNDLKETTHLAEVLDPQGSWTPRTGGWLELNNGFMFFTDETMFKNTAELFGVAVTV